MADDALKVVPAARREMLEGLKRAGEATVETLATQHGYSPSAVRSLLVSLTADGLVEWRSSRQSRGRPAHLFRLTPAAERLFPQVYDRALNSAMAFLSEKAPALLADLMDRWLEDTRLSNAQLAEMGRLQVSDKARRIATAQNAAGLISIVESNENEVALVLVHCPIIDVARNFPIVCQNELAWINQNTGEQFERTEHRLAGARRCVYAVAVGEPVQP